MHAQYSRKKMPKVPTGSIDEKSTYNWLTDWLYFWFWFDFHPATGISTTESSSSDRESNRKTALSSIKVISPSPDEIDFCRWMDSQIDNDLKRHVHNSTHYFACWWFCVVACRPKRKVATGRFCAPPLNYFNSVGDWTHGWLLHSHSILSVNGKAFAIISHTSNRLILAKLRIMWISICACVGSVGAAYVNRSFHWVHEHSQNPSVNCHSKRETISIAYLCLHRSFP